MRPKPATSATRRETHEANGQYPIAAIRTAMGTVTNDTLGSSSCPNIAASVKSLRVTAERARYVSVPNRLMDGYPQSANSSQIPHAPDVGNPYTFYKHCGCRS